jgi:hypothetical protein
MKTTNKLMVLIVMGIPMLFSRCTFSEDLTKIQNSLDSVKLYIGTPQFNTLAHLEFVDAATHLPIEDQDVKVSISGRDAALIYNNMGAQLSEYTGRWGLLDLVVDPHKVDTSALRTNPVEFVITPTMAGYIGYPQLVLICNPNTNNVIVPMINLSAPPPGYYNSGEITIGNTNSNGQIGGGTTINLAPRRISESRSVFGSGQGTIWFLDGTTLLDASGKTLIGSVSYDFSSNENDRNGWPISISYGVNLYKEITEYFDFSLQFYVTPDGGVKTPVANFGNSGGIIFGKTIPSALINNETGAPFKEGDKIDRWQTTTLIDGSNGNSTKDVIRQVSTIGGDGPGLADTLKNMIDLKSTWGSSMDYGPVTTTINIYGVITRPDANVTVYILGVPPGLMAPTEWNCEQLANYDLNFYNTTGSKQFKYTYYTTFITNNYFSLSNSCGLTLLPTNFSYTPVFSHQSLTFTQDITVTEDIASAKDLVTANIDLTIVNSSKKRLAIKPNVNIEVGVSGSMQLYTLNNGRATVSLKLSQPYIVHGAFGTSSGVGILTVTEVDNNYVAKIKMTIGSMSNQESSYTTPISADKNSDINYTIPVSDDVFNQLKNQ